MFDIATRVDRLGHNQTNTCNIRLKKETQKLKKQDIFVFISYVLYYMC